MNATLYFTIRSFFLLQKRQAGDFRLLFSHHPRSVTLICTSLQMPVIAKPTFRWSTEEMVGPWNHRSVLVYVHLPVYSACVALNSGFMWLRCIEPRLSRNLPKSPEIFTNLWKSSNLFKIFHSVRKLSILSRKFPDCLEILQTFQKSYRLSRNLPGCPEIS